MKSRLGNFGLVIKHRQAEAQQLAHSIALELIRKKKTIYLAEESRDLAAQIQRDSPKGAKIRIVKKIQLINHCDMIIVLGGDGTYLSIARHMKKKSIPVLGINAGRLGFLTEIKQEEAHAVIKSILDGKELPISKRLLLDVSVIRNKKIVFQGPVVNDCVVSKSAIARIIDIEVSINGQSVNRVRADGIIVATPTGSTAYSLSAGGPIVEPQVPALIITPICPHSLAQRSLVVHEDSEIKIRIKERPEAVLLTLDGQDVIPLSHQDEIRIKSFKLHKLKLVSSPDRDYFGLIREKLQFGGQDARNPKN